MNTITFLDKNKTKIALTKSCGKITYDLDGTLIIDISDNATEFYGIDFQNAEYLEIKRYYGDEFHVLAINSDLKNAAPHLNAIRFERNVILDGLRHLLSSRSSTLDAEDAATPHLMIIKTTDHVRHTKESLQQERDQAAKKLYEQYTSGSLTYDQFKTIIGA